MKKMNRRTWILTLAITFTALTACSGGDQTKKVDSAPATAQEQQSEEQDTKEQKQSVQKSAESDYPKEVIHMVVTFSAGGGNDLIARATAAAMEEVSGGTVVVDNITGAGGMTGTQEVVSAKPDGYTILCQDSSLTSMLVTQKPEFTLDDLVPVASVYSCPTWVLSNSDRGYQNLQDFVDAAKAKPGELTIGTAVTTGAQYLMGCAIANYFDLDVTIIPYTGGNELKAAILGNQVDIGVVHSPILLPEVKEGMVDVLAAGEPLTGINEVSLKDVKTLADYGMDVSFSSTRGFLVPKDTPEEVVAYLEDLFSKCVEAEAMKEFASTFGFEPSYQNRKEYTGFLQEELQGYQTVFGQIQ